MAGNSILWKCHPRTRAKLAILRSYLGAWFGILAAKKFSEVYYIDGFCGPGEYSDGEEGSPVIAARLASSTAQKFPGFRANLIFIDSDADALAHLKSMSAIKKQHPNVNIEIRESTFADEIESIVSVLDANPKSPVFSFVDPFGFGQSPLEKIKMLMHNQSSEIFVNFMCGFMNRFKEHDDEEVTDKIRNMVGEDDLQKFIASEDSIGEFCAAFEKNLREIGRYTLKFMMRDESNIRDNAFFFCGQNPRGFEKIKESMWKMDPVHGNSFSAHRELKKEQSQEDLFIVPAQTHDLSHMLFEQFSGRQNVSVQEIFRWVAEETDTYLPKHARTELENLLDRGSVISVKDPNAGGRKRRKNNWPERLLLSFATNV